jgi:MraZ protein
VFLGEFQHTLDTKGRVSLPARFRNEMTARIVVSKGMEGSLYVFPAENFEESIERLLESNEFDPKVRKVRRFFMSGATDVEIDSAGRMTIPPHLREYAKLEKEVAVIGNGDRIELWDSGEWERYNSETTEHIENLAAELVDSSQL